MKEIEKLNEAAKRVIGNGECPFNSVGCADCDKCLITDMEHRVAAAESMLERAKVFDCFSDGNLEVPYYGHEFYKFPILWKTPDGLPYPKKFRVIIIEEADDAGK